jgi:fumarate reductase flavoprotein subunit
MTDVVVIGGGGSGLRAALAAAEGGASVDLFEKTEDAGGKTKLSIGIMTASQSSFQRRAGIDDTHERHLDDIRSLVHEAGKQIADESMVRFILEQSAEEVEQLAALGVRFSGPHPEGAHKTPRMHVIQPDCRELARVLIAACEDAGVRIHTSSPGRGLVFEDGRISGAVVATPSGERTVPARAVVLTAGDYSGDPAFIRSVAPDAPLAQVFRSFASGDGHRMAMRAGAATLNMASINTPHLRFRDWPFVEPSPKVFAAGAILMNASGERVATTTDSESAGLIGYDGTSDLYMVIDAATAPKLASAADDDGIGRNGWRRTGKPFIGTAPGVGFAYLADCARWTWSSENATPAAVVQRTGAPSDAVERTLAGTTGPYTVLGPLGCYLMNTGGGLAVNRTMNVLATSGEPIPGLYSGGTNARIIPYIGHGYALAWAMASGRIAGHSAALQA